MNTTFKDLGVSETILKALKEMGFETPTVVQEQAIGPVLENRDLIVKSKTGSGKTAAFGIPLIQNLNEDGRKPQALILAPTRELAVQVETDLKKIGKHSKVKLTSVYGQHNINTEIDALEKGVHIVSGTPGRVMDHIKRGTLNTREIKYLVLDEADRMLDMGFIDQVVNIIKRLPQDRVTLLFSATMPNEIKNICQKYMKQPDTIEIESETETVDAITQYYYRVDHHEKRKQMNRVILVENPESCIVFCNTRHEVDRVNEYLRRKGYASFPLHGAISQSRRMKTIDKFKKGDFTFLVATDVASRGIHVDDISHVINYDVPLEKDSYTHRIGRTGRAGNGGKAITIATSEDIMSLYEIEEHIGAMIDERDLPTDAEVAECKEATEKALHHHARNLKEKEKRQTEPKKTKSSKSKKPKKSDAPKKPHKSDKKHESGKAKDDHKKSSTPAKASSHPKAERTEKPKTQKTAERPAKVQQKPVAEASTVKVVQPNAKKSLFKRVYDHFFGPKWKKIN